MNKGLIIVLVLLGAIGLLLLCGVVSLPKPVTPPPVVTAEEEPTIEEKGEGYMLADADMNTEIERLEERDYTGDGEVALGEVVGFGGDVGATL